MTILDHSCAACGHYHEEIEAVANQIVCISCKTKNDIWFPDEFPPIRHLLLTFNWKVKKLFIHLWYHLIH